MIATKYLKANTRKKLLKLADFLENNVKPNWFNIRHWARKGFEKKECGTTACAFGWATQIWPRELKFRDPYLDECSEYWEVEYTRNGTLSFSAAADFFGITYGEAEFLFHPDCYPSMRDKNGDFKYDKQGEPKRHARRMDVVRRIRKFVETDGESYVY